MTRSLLLAIAAASALTACSPPSAAKCSQNSDCPGDAICVTGICQKGVPSGGSATLVGASGRMTSGTRTMDVLVGQPFTPVGSAGTKTMTPAENTR